MLRRLLWWSVAVLAGAGPLPGQTRLATAPRGRLVPDSVRSAAISGNRYGDSPLRSVLVYLPPSYGSSPARRYPTVYLLHGFGSTERSWVGGYGGFNIQTAMDSLVAAGAVREMIVIMPNGRNRLGGSFYTNSESSGNWETFITGELVAHVDSVYRTIPTAESRGLAGHSMGGYGVFALGMRHAGDLYGALYALSGCCTRFSKQLTPEGTELWATLHDLGSLNEARALSFYPEVYLALAAAFSPNPNLPPLYVDLPFEKKAGRWQPVDDVVQEWVEHSPFDMVFRYVDRLRRLHGFVFDVGTHDDLVDPASLRSMDSVLTRVRVPHTFETYDGDHNGKIGLRMVANVLPFFSRTLVFIEPRH